MTKTEEIKRLVAERKQASDEIKKKAAERKGKTKDEVKAINAEIKELIAKRKLMAEELKKIKSSKVSVRKSPEVTDTSKSVDNSNPSTENNQE